MRTALAALLLLVSPDGGTPDAGHEHCWHYATFQHLTVGHGGDYVCCSCGATECRPSAFCVVPASGHGAFAPLEYQFVERFVDGGCPWPKREPTP